MQNIRLKKNVCLANVCLPIATVSEQILEPSAEAKYVSNANFSPT